MSETIYPLGAEEGQDFVIGYMCLTDFECELGLASGGNVIHPSVEDLKRRRTCVESCGIAEVKVTLQRVVQPAKDYDEQVFSLPQEDGGAA